MRINNNIAALNAWRGLTQTDGALSKSLEKLSSGLRINRAGDDAAGLAISEKMRGQIRGLNMASKNAQDGISLIQTAEGALNETHSILQRMRELAVQSASDTNSNDDRAELQKEVAQLISEIDRIGNDTEFNTKNLLDGGAGVQMTATNTNVSNLVGTADTSAGSVAMTAANITLATTAAVSGGTVAFLAEADATANFNAATTIGIGGINYSFATTDTIQSGLDAINADSATHGVTASFTTAVGLTLTAVGSGSSYGVDITAIGTGDLTHANLVVGETSGADVVVGGDELGGSYEAAGNHILVTSGDYKGLEFDLTGDADVTVNISANNSLKVQIGANANQNMSISVNDMRSAALGVDGVNIATRAGADSAITVIQNATDRVSQERSKLGAIQNRLEHSINNLGTASENLTAAESRIRDVDMAAEMMEFTKKNILAQAGTAMLAQANQAPQGVLQLLR